MKKTLFALMCLMGLVACEKEKADTPTDQGRDIYYTVSDGSSVSGFSGTTAHINTDAEFDALLDRFCDFAQNGEQVMFCGSHPASHTKASSSDTPTSITTTDREELKAWMKEMEKAGKTVQISYDDNNGTWNGRAYANLGQEDMREARMYTGTLTFVQPPVLEEPPLGGVVWAMQVNADSTLIITLQGMMMWNDSIDENMRMIQGATLMLEGVVGSHTDLQGNPFMTLSLNIEEN